MEKKSNKNWIFLTINGLVFILFGVLLLFFFNEATLKTIFLATGITLLLAGVILFILVINHLKQDKGISLLLLQSITSVALGLVLLLFQDQKTIFFITIGVWAVIVGIFQLVILVNVPKNIVGKNLLLFNGLLTLALGVYLILRPPLDYQETVVTVIGVLAVLFGIGMVWLAVLTRNVRLKKEEPPAGEPAVVKEPEPAPGPEPGTPPGPPSEPGQGL